mmetsp:Transcript_49665/g.108034  ORF Transcript_49665/g.108034 Transcript_49665/m.108034 type:complete len:95 (+) Transcript_49665:127-411(+)
MEPSMALKISTENSFMPQLDRLFDQTQMEVGCIQSNGEAAYLEAICGLSNIKDLVKQMRELTNGRVEVEMHSCGYIFKKDVYNKQSKRQDDVEN